MSEKYILRHKLKNPTYTDDSEHQWFDIIDVLQNVDNENNKITNKIYLHGILKDKDSVSTDNIEDNAVTAIKTDFKIYGNGTVWETKTDDYGNDVTVKVPTPDNVLIIEKGTISADDLDVAAKNLFTSVTINSLPTIPGNKIAEKAITTYNIDRDNVNWDIIFQGNPNANPHQEPHLLSGANIADESISGEKLKTQLLGAIISTADDLDNMFDSTQTGALSDWDQNHLGIWIKI